MLNSNSTILALDFGGSRIGVARANIVARLASPLTTLQASENLVQEIKTLVVKENAAIVVVGLPRNLQGDDTPQTLSARAFAATLEAALAVPIYLQDEALTSQKAETELKARSRSYTKEAIDSLAATYILEDFLLTETAKELSL